MNEKITKTVQGIINKFLEKLKDVKHGYVDISFDVPAELDGDQNFWNAFNRACYRNNISWTLKFSDNFGDFYYYGTIQHIREEN